MKTSFYLTPELQEKLVHLTYRQDDKLELWANRFRLFEHDPTKGAGPLSWSTRSAKLDIVAQSNDISVVSVCTRHRRTT